MLKYTKKKNIDLFVKRFLLRLNSVEIFTHTLIILNVNLQY